jgi:hypothetical protein
VLVVPVLVVPVLVVPVLVVQPCPRPFLQPSAEAPAPGVKLAKAHPVRPRATTARTRARCDTDPGWLRPLQTASTLDWVLIDVIVLGVSRVTRPPALIGVAQ